VWKGKSFTVKKGAPNFLQLREAVVSEKWDEIEGHLTVKKSLESWAGGDFQVRNGKFYYGDEELPEELNQRISEMAAQNEDPISVLNFYKRLKKNPSYRSVNQLWRFMKHRGIPLTKAGTFLAYKGVRADYKDQHSGTFLNTPGAELEMDRNKVSDDPNTACHEGFHVGALESLKTQLTERLKRETRAQIPPELITYPDLQFVSIDTDSLRLEGEGVKFTAQIKGTMVSYLMSRSLFESAIAKDVLSDHSYTAVTIPSVASLNVNPKSSIPANPTTPPDLISIEVSGNGSIITKAPIQRIKESLIGTKRGSFDSIISTFSEVSSASFKIRPFWAPFFPKKDSYIKVNIK
jgi:hypothetical protein